MSVQISNCCALLFFTVAVSVNRNLPSFSLDIS